jgi:hypothetical protein
MTDDDKQIKSMFDEVVSMTIRRDGTVEKVSTGDHQAEAMREACGLFLTAQREFEKINAHPLRVSDIEINCRWWDCLERTYEAEKAVWRLFVGPQPCMEDNKLYAKFRELLLKGSNLKANA